MRAILRQAFAYAEEESYITRNPFEKAKAPPVERRIAATLSASQRAAYLNQYVGHPLEGLFHLYARVGLRKGEGEGLRWADINWEDGTITIAQQYTDVNGRAFRSTPKTPRSRRAIPIPEDLLELLRDHYAWQRKHAAECAEWHEHGLVFPSEVGTPLEPSNVNRLHNTMLENAGLPRITVHDLRHTASYLLEREGAPESARMALLGHSTAQTARHYTDHADIEDMRQMFRKRAGNG